jgi:hypothetical protein
VAILAGALKIWEFSSELIIEKFLKFINLILVRVFLDGDLKVIGK